MMHHFCRAVLGHHSLAASSLALLCTCSGFSEHLAVGGKQQSSMIIQEHCHASGRCTSICNLCKPSLPDSAMCFCMPPPDGKCSPPVTAPRRQVASDSLLSGAHTHTHLGYGLGIRAGDHSSRRDEALPVGRNVGCAEVVSPPQVQLHQLLALAVLDVHHLQRPACMQASVPAGIHEAHARAADSGSAGQQACRNWQTAGH